MFDFQGTLLREKNLENCIMDSVTDFENGKCAFYIDGADGFYATMMDENGEFLFEPIKCYEDIGQKFNVISEGLLRINYDKDITKFVDEKGEEIITINTYCENVGDCKNGYICVNEGNYCYYISKNNNRLF